MGNVCLVPEWFFGYDVSLEMIFAIITLVLSLYAFKIYSISRDRQIKLFGMAFGFISLSYFLQSFVNFSIISEINENICGVLTFFDIVTLNIVGMRLYMVFFLAGLVTLTYMTFRIKSSQIYSLMMIITIVSILSSTQPTYLFRLISSVLLAYILFYYIINYMKRRKKNSLLIPIAFAFLLFGSIHFFFSVNHGIYYVIGHIMELIAYLLILIKLISVLRK